LVQETGLLVEEGLRHGLGDVCLGVVVLGEVGVARGLGSAPAVVQEAGPVATAGREDPPQARASRRNPGTHIRVPR
jgi:hypothetical protein